MTQFLPQNLLALFAPRDPIPFLPPPDKLPHEKKTNGYAGIGQYVNLFEDPKDTPPPVRIETREERQERKRREKAEQVAYKLEQDIALWDPANNAAATSDPYRTLFVARINYDSSESKLRREFEVYGPVRKVMITLVHDNKTGKPRGYAFIEYEHERDMHSAYKHADGKKIDGRRVLVDVERGRIVKGWLPRRLGGGLGGTRRGGPEVNVKHSGREDSRLDGSYLERDRDRGERGDRDRDREKRRSRSRDRDRKRRSRSRDRHRDRDRGRDRSMSAIEKTEDGLNGVTAEVKKRDRRRSRSRDRGGRDRDRDRKRRRSRSKSRERKRRDRGDREDRRDRGDKEDRRNQDDQMGDVVIKQEPVDEGYDQAEYGYNNVDPQDYANTTFKTDNDDDDYGYNNNNNDGYSN